MTQVLAAEGGYQAFNLSGSEWGWLIFAAAVAVVALLLGVVLMRGVLAEEQGTEKMQEIAGAIQEGALAYLRRQFRTIAIIVVPVAVVVFLTSTKINEEADGEVLGVALTYAQSGTFRTIAFIVGAVFSGAIGFIGMSLAVRGNVRTAAAARRSDFPAALKVAFRTGGVAGLLTVGLGFGGSLIALFMRVGGGIFTKAADVGADLVGKVEAGIPEDDPRNPATIADNVGDNVGDCAGMASDLFESYEVTLVASIILGVPAFHAIFPTRPELWAAGALFPLGARALGLLASIVGVFTVKATDKDTSAMAPINRGFLTASIITVVSTLVLALVYIGNPDGSLENVGLRMFGAVVIGLLLAQGVSRITEYFTSTETRPVQDIADATAGGPATTVLTGTAIGLESAVWAVVAIAIALGAAIALGDGNLQFIFYLVALTGMGMLATTGVIVSEDTFGPVADNAAGIAEMSGEFTGEAEKVMVSLDAVGNTTKAVTKGFAIGSAVIAAVALLASYIETIGNSADEFKDYVYKAGETVFSVVTVNVADPKVFIGLLIGGAVPFMFSSLAIAAVSRTAGVVVDEVRAQFADGKIMSGEKRPDYAPVIDICTQASLRELTTPALLAVLTPLVIGFGIGWQALAAFLASVIVVGQLMANYLSTSGGAWDNAKKYIEDGHHGGKGSKAHEAAVIGDTVGDPFKDTAGPALNPLIKVMNLVSLLVLPAILSLEDNDGARLAIAAVCLLVLLGSITFSKRRLTKVLDDAEAE